MRSVSCSSSSVPHCIRESELDSRAPVTTPGEDDTRRPSMALALAPDQPRAFVYDLRCLTFARCPFMLAARSLSRSIIEPGTMRSYRQSGARQT